MTEALSGWTTLGTLDTSNVDAEPSSFHAVRSIKPPGRYGRDKRRFGRYFRVTVSPGGTVIRQTSRDGLNWQDELEETP